MHWQDTPPAYPADEYTDTLMAQLDALGWALFFLVLVAALTVALVVGLVLALLRVG